MQVADRSFRDSAEAKALAVAAQVTVEID